MNTKKPGRIHDPRVCKECGVTYFTKYTTTSFCSILCSCRDRAKEKSKQARMGWKRNCLKCGVAFESRIKSVRFCSIRCSKLSKPIRSCLSCGQLTIRPKYCSMNCRDAGKRKLVICMCCSTSVLVHKSVVRRGGMAGSFCSSRCVNDYRTGDKNPNWRGGGSYWRGKGWRRICKVVRDRDNHTCQDCGAAEIKCKHHVHHISPWRDTHDNSLVNLVTLCPRCHGKRKVR